MQVEKGVTGRSAKSRTGCDNMLFTKCTDGLLIYSVVTVDKRIDVGDRLTKVHHHPSGLPSLQCIEPVGQGYSRLERIKDTGEGSA